jgi:hypothetical protein
MRADSVVALRLDHEQRYLVELAAAHHKISMARFIRWAVLEKLERGEHNVPKSNHATENAFSSGSEDQGGGRSYLAWKSECGLQSGSSEGEDRIHQLIFGSKKRPDNRLGRPRA